MIQKIQMNKLDYLQKQNTQLHQQIQDLRETIKINKVEIDILSKQLQGNPSSKKLMDVIFSYRDREEKLQTNIAQLKKQISQLLSDNLVLRQLNDGQNIEMKNMEILNLQAIELLNQKIKEMEDKIASYEKTHKEYDKISGFVIKNRDIVSPQDLAIGLRDKEYEWKDQIQIMKAEVEQYKKNQQNLMVVNTVLRNRIVSLQAQLAMPNRNLGQVLDKSLKKLMLYFIEVQKKIITGEQDSESDEQNDIQLIAPQLSGIFPQKQMRIQKDYGVPHIDLLKVREQVNQSNNKIKEALLARNHLTDKEKIQRLQIELQYTRRQLSRNIIDLRDQKEKRKKAEALANELQARLTLLVNSNQHLEAKVRKYWQKLKSEKEKFYGLSDNQETGKGLIEQQINNIDETLALPQEPLKKSKKHEKKLAANPSLLLNEYQIDYKIHLQIMAKELDKNKKLQHLQSLRPIKQDEEHPEEHKKLKRSTSNPLLYFNERKENIMTIKDEGDQNQDSHLRLEQTYYVPGKNNAFEEVLEDLDV